MKKETSYLVLAIVIALAIVSLYFLNVGPTGFVVSEETYNNLSRFNATGSVWTNVSWGGSSIIISENKTFGEFISGVLDAGEVVSWDNVTFSGSENLTFEVTSCSISNCSDGSLSSVANLTSLGVSNARYFQYKVLFDNLTGASSLESVVVSYVTIPLTVTINSPVNQEYSTNTVELNVSIGDSSDLDNTWYTFDSGVTNVSFSSENVVQFNLTDGGYDLVVYANDTGGEIESASVSFTVDVPTCDSDNLDLCEDETSCDGAEGYWYDEVCNDVAESSEDSEVTVPETASSEAAISSTPTTPEIVHTPVSNSPLVLGDIENLTLDPGSSENIILNMTNEGSGFLFTCALTLSGDYVDWASYENGSKNINPSESVSYDVTINVPSDVEDGTYTIFVEAGCSGASSSKEILVVVEKKKLDFELISSQRGSSENVLVVYSLEELAGENQEITIAFSLLDVEGLSLASVEESVEVVANSVEEFSVEIPVNGTLDGELNLQVSFNSQIYSDSVLEHVTLGAPIGGFAIFEGLGTGKTIVFGSVVTVLLLLFLIARKMRKSGKTLKSVAKKVAPKNDGGDSPLKFK